MIFLVTKLIGISRIIMLSAIEIQHHISTALERPFKKAVAYDDLFLDSLLGLENQTNCQQTSLTVVKSSSTQSFTKVRTNNESYLNARIRLYDAQKYGSKKILTDNSRLMNKLVENV